jgi:hypothetical protein
LRFRPLGRLGTLLVLGCLVLLGLLYYKPLRTYFATRHTLVERRADVQALAVQKQRLEERLKEVQTPSSLVASARRLGLVKPGEHLFIVRGISDWRRAHARPR